MKCYTLLEDFILPTQSTIYSLSAQRDGWNVNDMLLLLLLPRLYSWVCHSCSNITTWSDFDIDSKMRQVKHAGFQKKRSMHAKVCVWERGKEWFFHMTCPWSVNCLDMVLLLWMFYLWYTLAILMMHHTLAAINKVGWITITLGMSFFSGLRNVNVYLILLGIHNPGSLHVNDVILSCMHQVACTRFTDTNNHHQPP